MRLVLVVDLFGFDDGVDDELVGIEVFGGEFEGSDLVVIVGGVVEDAFLEVVTVGVDGVFEFVVAEVAAAELLVDRVEDVEELADAGEFVVFAIFVAGVSASEGDFGEARPRREVARKADGTHAAAVLLEREVRGELIFGSSGGEMHVVIEGEKLLVKRRVVGKDTSGVVVDFETCGDRFNNDAGAGGVTHDPVEFGRRKFRAEAEVAEVDAPKEGFGFGDISATTEEPGEKFKLGDVVLAVDVIVVNGVADEVETGDAETFFVDGVIEKRIVLFAVGFLSDVGDAHDGVVGVQSTDFAEGEGEVARDDDGVFAVGKLVIEVAAEIMVFNLISGGGAHSWFSCLCF